MSNYGGSSYQGGGASSSGGGHSKDFLTRTAKPNFSTMTLAPFEKDFYLEHPAVTARSEAEIEEYRARKEIHIYGEGVPRPVTTFLEASFPE